MAYDANEAGTDWYAGRESVAGGTDNPWSERADFGQRVEDVYSSVEDTKFSYGPTLSQADLSPIQSYDKVTADDQALYGTK